MRKRPNQAKIVANMMLDFQWKVRNESPGRQSELSAANIAFNRVNAASERMWFEIMQPEERDFCRLLYLDYNFRMTFPCNNVEEL